MCPAGRRIVPCGLHALLSVEGCASCVPRGFFRARPTADPAQVKELAAASSVPLADRFSSSTFGGTNQRGIQQGQSDVRGHTVTSNSFLASYPVRRGRLLQTPTTA
jgi:hypothetical protein